VNKKTLSGLYGYFNLVHGVTLKAIGAFSDEELDFRPKPEMRSVKELIHHIYASEKTLASGALNGKVTAEAEAAEQEKLAGITSVAAAQDYARNCHEAAAKALDAITDEGLAASVDSPFGSFQGWQYFTFAYDEHWHHRGQLYTYMRLLGKQPPFLYDY
jgi:uncharacterized damage-inducible protein DinB